jgi:hypothetical protein
MKKGKVRLVILVVTMMMLNFSSCSAWFGNNKRKSGRNYILPDEAIMSSRPSLMNHAAGSSIVFPIYGNVYPVGYDISLLSMLFILFHVL